MERTHPDSSTHCPHIVVTRDKKDCVLYQRRGRGNSIELNIKGKGPQTIELDCEDFVQSASRFDCYDYMFKRIEEDIQGGELRIVFIKVLLPRNDDDSLCRVEIGRSATPIEAGVDRSPIFRKPLLVHHNTNMKDTNTTPNINEVSA